MDSYLGNNNDPLSLNLYTYCHNNPVYYIDPSGHGAIGNFFNGVWNGAKNKVTGAYTYVKSWIDNPSEKAYDSGIILRDLMVEIFKTGDPGDFVLDTTIQVVTDTGETIIFGSAEERGELTGEILIDILLAKGLQKGSQLLGKIKPKNLYLARYGDDFGKMGKYVENPNIAVNWDEFAEHGLQRMSKRGVTQDMVNNWVENGKALSQNGGNKFAFVTQDGVAVVSKEGKLITTWGKSNFDDNMLNIIEQLYGK